MKITIINNEKKEKRYSREELSDFVTQLKDGTYSLVADTGYTLVTTNRIEVAGQADVNGYEATALPPGTISGYVMAEDGSVVQYGAVTLFRSKNDMEGETVAADGYGAYRFAGLEDGEYAVFARPYGAFKGVLATRSSPRRRATCAWTSRSRRRRAPTAP